MTICRHNINCLAPARTGGSDYSQIAQQTVIKVAYPLDFYRSALLLRVVLFVFTVVGCATATKFIMFIFNYLFKSPGYHTATGIVCLLCAAGNLTVLESTIKNSRPYHTGYDNVLLYAARVPYSC